MTGPRRDALVVGAGPDASDAVLRLVDALPWPLPWPVVVVLQNAGPAELDRLVAAAPRPLALAWDRQAVGADAVHLAPAGYHLLFEADWLALSPDAPEHGARPAIAPLFESAAWTLGRRARGVLLGAVGADGDAAAAALAGTVRAGAAAPPHSYLSRERSPW